MQNTRNHNKGLKSQAEYRAMEMRLWPSPLEERMKKFLEKHGVKYECQKVFYVYDNDGKVVRYYIADFYIPDRQVVIEMDGKQHQRHKQYDKCRTKAIQEICPEVEVLRFEKEDLSDSCKMEELAQYLA